VSEPTPLDVLRASLDPLRLSVLGDAAAGPVSLKAVADRMGVSTREVAEAVGHLRAVGLLDGEGALATDALRSVARVLPPLHAELGKPVEGPWTSDEAATLGRFFDGGRLVRIPQSSAKRRLVLEKIAQSFEPGRRYPERDVNFMIQVIHPDYAAIRRSMVEEGLMDRADGAYWRVGGRYDAPPVSDVEEPDDRVISTSRHGIVLRPYDIHMVDALVVAANDPRINRFMRDSFPHPYTVDDARTWVDLATASDPPTHFAIVTDGVLVGGCGGSPGVAEFTGTCEIGWWLNPAWWGRGITTAAVTALIDEFFGSRGFMRLWAPVMAPNRASQRVAEKAGMVFEGVSPSAYLKDGVRYDQYHFGLTRRQWSKGRTVGTESIANR